MRPSQVEQKVASVTCNATIGHIASKRTHSSLPHKNTLLHQHLATVISDSNVMADRLIAAIAKYPGPTGSKIKCHDNHFHVHKVLLCANSPFIDAELKHGFKEEQEGVSEQEHFNADTVERMITFVYLADYDVEPPTVQELSTDVNTLQSAPDADDNIDGEHTGSAATAAGTGSPAPQDNPSPNLNDSSDVREQTLAHMHVWAIADYCGISKLKVLAAKRFIDMIRCHWGAALTPSSLIPILQEASKHTLRHNDLRTSLYEALSGHLTDLVQDPIFANSLGSTEGLQEFAADLLPLTGDKLVSLQ